MNKDLNTVLLASCFFCLCTSVSCMPAFEDSNPSGCQPDAQTASLHLSTDPPAELEQVPRVLRLLVRDQDQVVADPLEPSDFVLLAGTISNSQLEQLGQQQELPESLAKRVVSSIAWANSPDEVVVAPTVALEPAERYVLANSALGTTQSIEVATYDPLPMLRFVWPQAGHSLSGAEAVWCGASTLTAVAQRVELAPASRHGFILNGASSSDPGRRCVHFELEPSSEIGTPGPALPPVVLSDTAGKALARIEPHPLRDGAASIEPLVPVLCEPPETAFGPGCAVVQDDRISVRSPEGAALWSVVSSGPTGATEHLATTERGSRFVLSGFVPNSQLSITLTVLDAATRSLTATVNAQMSAPMPHLIISEVLANPIGPEPQQEWVELYNDGLAPAMLGDYLLNDVGGVTSLPSALLPPGGYALLVNEGFDDSGEYDTPPDSTALLLPVAKLGKGGLSNAGEPLKLTTVSGQVQSRFPSDPKPKAGRSVYRKWPKALADEAEGFALSEPGAATPGTSNVAKD